MKVKDPRALKIWGVISFIREQNPEGRCREVANQLHQQMQAIGMRASSSSGALPV